MLQWCQGCDLQHICPLPPRSSESVQCQLTDLWLTLPRSSAWSTWAAVYPEPQAPFLILSFQTRGGRSQAGTGHVSVPGLPWCHPASWDRTLGEEEPHHVCQQPGSLNPGELLWGPREGTEPGLVLGHAQLWTPRRQEEDRVWHGINKIVPENTELWGMEEG